MVKSHWQFHQLHSCLLLVLVTGNILTIVHVASIYGLLAEHGLPTLSDCWPDVHEVGPYMHDYCAVT